MSVIIWFLAAVFAAPAEAWEAAQISFNQQRVPDEQRAESLWKQACTKGHKPSCEFTTNNKDSWVKKNCAQASPLACTIQNWLSTQYPNSSGTVKESTTTFEEAHISQEKACMEDPTACFFVLPSSPYHKKVTQQIQKNCSSGHKPSCIQQAQRMLDIDPLASRAKSILTENCNKLSPQACTYLAGIYINQKQYSNAARYLEESCSSLHTVGCRLLGLQLLQTKSPQEAIPHFRTACSGNDVLSCLTLAQLYTGDSSKQLSFLQKSCRLRDAQSCALAAQLLGTHPSSSSYRAKGCYLNHADSCFTLGFSYEKSSTPQKALPLYEHGCAIQHAPSCVNGGALAFAEKKKSLSVSLYQQGCQLGDPKACSTLGLLYLRGETGEVQITSAHRLLTIGCAARLTNACDALFTELPKYATRRCEQGNVEDCYLAAQFQEKQHPEQARALAQKGCDGTSSLSCVKLGYYWVSGIGGKIDKEQARILFVKGCNEKTGSGCYNLGLLNIESGNQTKSIDYFKQACTMNDPRGCVQGALLLQQSNPQKSLSLYESGCSLLDGGACTKLGNIILDTNPKKARGLYEKGCSLGNAQACQNLAGCTHKGIGGEKNEQRTQQLMDRACNLGSKAACSMKR